MVLFFGAYRDATGNPRSPSSGSQKKELFSSFLNFLKNNAIKRSLNENQVWPQSSNAN